MHMKHILPILAITTLAAAASAQSAAASSGLSYNRVGLTYSDNSEGYVLSASSLLGNTNVLLSASTTIDSKSAAGNHHATASLGYVFKNVAFGSDAIVALSSDESYSLSVRKDIGSSFEVGAAYSRDKSTGSYVNVWGVEVAYNITKQYQAAISYADLGSGNGHAVLYSLRYNF